MTVISETKKVETRNLDETLNFVEKALREGYKAVTVTGPQLGGYTVVVEK